MCDRLLPLLMNGQATMIIPHFSLLVFHLLHDVPHAAHGFNHGVAEFGAEMADIDIDAVFLDVIVFAPNGFDDFVAGEDFADIFEEVFEEQEFVFGKLGGRAVKGDFHFACDHFERAVFEEHGFLRRIFLRAAEHGVHAGEQFFDFEGL